MKKIEAMVLEQFEKMSSILDRAKEQYMQEKYLASYKLLAGEGHNTFGRLQRFINSGLLLEKHRLFGGWGQLTCEEKEKLSSLNMLLSALEKKINGEAREIIERYERIIKPAGKETEDYEIDVTVDYYLDENDPEFTDDRDSILAHTFNSADKKKRLVFDTRMNWNDTDEKKGPRHCWLYHDLYDHAIPKLAWKDLLRIEMIWTEVIIRHQHFAYFSKAADCGK